MNQSDINQTEWENSENWSGSTLGVYFSKKDSRIWVPKKPSWLGWTLNLAHPAGVRRLFLLLLTPFFIVLAVMLIFLAFLTAC